jgi:hypothetical protein
MSPLHLFENRDGPKSGCRRQHRRDLDVEESGEGIGAATASRLLMMRRKPEILLEAIRGGSADRRLRGRYRRRVCLSELHVKPHLVIGDMAAGQRADPLDEKIHPHRRPVAFTRRFAPKTGASG